MKPSKSEARKNIIEIQKKNVLIAKDCLVKIEGKVPVTAGFKRFYYYESPALGVQYVQVDDLTTSLNARLIQDINNPKKFTLKVHDGEPGLLDSLLNIMEPEFKSQGLELNAEISQSEKIRLYDKIKKSKKKI